jgi:pimeloyl-ACP methyl ester carboxylesterase
VIDTLVLLPGLLNDARLFANQHAALAPRARRLVIPELWHQDSVAALAESVLAQLDGRFALAGFSMGGYVALELLRQAPQRIAALALIDTSAQADSEAQRARRQALIAQSAVGAFKGVTARLLPLLVHPDRLGDAALVGTLQAMAQAVGRDGFVRQQRAILGRPDSLGLLPSIAVPSAVICGRDDRLTPVAQSRAMAAAIPGAVLTEITDCGHVAPLEQPAAVTRALLQWLDRVD